MTIASISYDSLKEASNQAKVVAKKLDKYADAVYDSVYKKLNNYSGTWSSNVSTAKSKANEKIGALRAEGDRYENYATDLTDLKEVCESTDKSVKSKVSTLTAAFKESHGIKNNKVINTISYFFTSLGNSNAAFRWLGDDSDRDQAANNYLKESIKEWYNYEGGKDLIWGTVVAILEIAIAVVAVITTGGAALVVLAAWIGGTIAVVNGVMNIVNELRAYSATQNDDPATGKRRSSQDTIQDTLRTETDSRFWHSFATGMDIVNTVCIAITAFDGARKLFNKGFTWATGGKGDLSKMTRKQIFNAFTDKIKFSFSEAWTKTWTPIKLGDWTRMRANALDAAIDFKTDFLYFMKERFLVGDDALKNTLTGFKDIIKDGLNFKNVGKLALPCFPVLSEADISVGDFADIFSDFDFSSFSKETGINSDILKKLSEYSHISISIPELHFPEFRIDTPKIKVA